MGASPRQSMARCWSGCITGLQGRKNLEKLHRFSKPLIKTSSSLQSNIRFVLIVRLTHTHGKQPGGGLSMIFSLDGKPLTEPLEDGRRGAHLGGRRRIERHSSCKDLYRHSRPRCQGRPVVLSLLLNPLVDTPITVKKSYLHCRWASL